MSGVNRDLLSTWVKYKPSDCKDCWAGCCTLPVEVTKEDLLRLGLASQDEVVGSLKKVAKRLEREGVIQQFRARTGLFTLKEKNGGCLFLNDKRQCSVYEKRPQVCRRFPLEVGPKLGFCPYLRKSSLISVRKR